MKVAAISPTDVWAVGAALHDNDTISGVVRHFDGHSWHTVQDVGLPNELLSGISALASDDIYVGGSLVDLMKGTINPFFEHWNGSKWALVPLPPLCTTSCTSSDLTGAAMPTGQMWLSGSAVTDNVNEPVVLLTDKAQ